MPTRSSECKTWRCRFDNSTVSWSRMVIWPGESVDGSGLRAALAGQLSARRTDSGCGEVEEDGAAESACSDDEDVCILEFELACRHSIGSDLCSSGAKGARLTLETDLREHHLSAVAHVLAQVERPVPCSSLSRSRGMAFFLVRLTARRVVSAVEVDGIECCFEASDGSARCCQLGQQLVSLREHARQSVL